jgi:hypothetical protein
MRKRALITASLLTWAGLARAGILEDAREAARLLRERTKKSEPAPAPQPAVEAPERAGNPQKPRRRPLAHERNGLWQVRLRARRQGHLLRRLQRHRRGRIPLKWHLKGPKDPGNNAVEVVEYQGQRFLRARPGAAGGDQPSATQYLRLVTKGDLPARFTIEFDAVLGHSQIPDYPNPLPGLPAQQRRRMAGQ